MSRAWKPNSLWWFGLAVVGLLVNAGVCYRNLIRLVRNSQRVVKSQQVLNRLEEILSTVKDAETGQRGYLLTGKQEYLRPYRQAVEDIGTKVQNLQELTADQPYLSERLPQLQAAITAKLHELDSTVALHDHVGRQAALDVVQTDRGREAMDAVRSITGRLIDDETQRVVIRSDESKSTARTAQLAFTVATVVDLLLVAAVVMLIQRNMARRERDAEALRLSEEQLRLLVEGARDYALVLLDREGKVASWNAGAERLFGYPDASILGQSLTRLYPPDNGRDLQETPARQLSTATAEGRAEALGWRLRADGSRFWADAVLTALYRRDEGLIGYGLMTRDVSERRNVEERLRASESRFRRLAEAGLIGVVTIDGDGRVWEANDAFLRMVGYTRSDVDLGLVRWEVVTSPDGGDSLTPERLQAGALSGPIGSECPRKDGSRVPVLLGAARLDGSEGRFVCWVLDLTEQKRARAEADVINATLERRVLERTRQLQQANRELEAFSYSVSHDLRAPLRHVSGFADMLQKRADSGMDETSRRFVGIIADAAKNARRLVDDLLTFSRIGRSEFARTPVDMNELFGQSIRELEPETQGRDVRWTIGSLPLVPGDVAMLRQVVRNLLSNALKYTRDSHPAEIAVGSLRGCEGNAAREVTFFVRDNGVGFDMRYVDKLFGVFQRLHSAEQFEGTGIGLAIVRRIVARHGGWTKAEGEPGKGATIYFTLPSIAAGMPN